MVHYLNGFSMAAPLSPTLSLPFSLSLVLPLPIFIAIAAHFRFELGAVIVFLGALFPFQLDLLSTASANAAHSLWVSVFTWVFAFAFAFTFSLASFCIPFGFFATLRTFFFWFQFVVSRYTLAEVTFTLSEGILLSLNLIYLPCSSWYTVLVYIYWYTAIMAVIDGVRILQLKHFPPMIYSAFCLQFKLNRKLIDIIWYISRMKDYCTKLTSLCQRHLFL